CAREEISGNSFDYW
nr:immunoglobulin heavy chain junction region [Macaca mulatta]